MVGRQVWLLAITGIANRGTINFTVAVAFQASLLLREQFSVPNVSALKRHRLLQQLDRYQRDLPLYREPIPPRVWS
jgi:hypothetical protein